MLFSREFQRILLSLSRTALPLTSPADLPPIIRKLKPSARPVELPDDPYRLVSCVDYRLMTFESVNVARLWIKGGEFIVKRLLGDVYKCQAQRYYGGAVAIFRLAPLERSDL